MSLHLRRLFIALPAFALAFSCHHPLPKENPALEGVATSSADSQTLKQGELPPPLELEEHGSNQSKHDEQPAAQISTAPQAPVHLTPPRMTRGRHPQSRSKQISPPHSLGLRSRLSPAHATESRALGGQGLTGDVAVRPLRKRKLHRRIAPVPPRAGNSQEQYAVQNDTPFARVSEQPLSTFSIDVDTASYSNVRRLLKQGRTPPRGAVRVEELINYFPFDYPNPKGDKPFSVTVEVSQAPWNLEHRLLHIGVQGKRLEASALPPRNLVFLLDVSGSMNSPAKLPLLKRSLATLTKTLREQDQVAIVVYAGASGLVLPPTHGDQWARILEALDRLQAGGSTNGAAGIQLAYQVATRMAAPGSSTRVVLATDGDFNVGQSSDSALYTLIERKRKTGVFLSVLGLGMGNYKDSTLEMLADRGNGNYAYLDTLSEARKVLVREGGATLTTLAKDVKLQVEFNPSRVAAYRLIGYENRRLAARDFNDDKKDAGELGAGHSVTALYEITPPGQELALPQVDGLKYQTPARSTGGHTGELAQLKLRYKEPTSSQSQLLSHPIVDHNRELSKTSDAFRFSAAVAAFGMGLTHSQERGSATFGLARSLGGSALGEDPHGYRKEFLQLVDRAERM